ncbi:zinc finger Y-chromosomal protein-like [Ylistrum balloti]|uniref:zinc finger Y-chromosomal protein-like n=1 Tax=Ylistrum balloti TaxID=509963 RepID=UPI002905D9C8|nr:zinc finger Y-chromosomal protein-like [Ylistrum balloti]
MDSSNGGVKKKCRKVYDCSECSYSTACRSNLNKHHKRHNRSIVQQVQGLICDRCGKKYATKFGLKLHIKSKHELVFKHLCELCGKGFNQSVQYKLHCSSHVIVPDNVCPMCKGEFSVESSLKRHMRICKEIHKSSSSKEMSDHCGHKCDQCHAFYTTKSGLRSHIEGMHQEAKFGSRTHLIPSTSKRKLDDLETEDAVGDNTGPLYPQIPPSTPSQPPRKCQVEEGYSWWTCAMYGMPYDKSKPQPRKAEGI